MEAWLSGLMHLTANEEGDESCPTGSNPVASAFFGGTYELV